MRETLSPKMLLVSSVKKISSFSNKEVKCCSHHQSVASSEADSICQIRELERQHGAIRQTLPLSSLCDYSLLYQEKGYSVLHKPLKHASVTDARTTGLENVLEVGRYSAFHSFALMWFSCLRLFSSL